MKILCVVGARPNFMKMAPVVAALQKRGVTPRLIHTGQHYDAAMSHVFFEQLGMPEPDAHLQVGSGSHGEQTARILMAFEAVCLEDPPDWVVVAGDVNSTLACALVAAKLGIPVAHVEAGLRSFDRKMPEEVNRVLTDHLSQLLFTTERSGSGNLAREGIAPERIHFVGNCMVDSLLRHRKAAEDLTPWADFGLEAGNYALVTLHRPSNVDDPEVLSRIFSTLAKISESLPVLFPVHPRTKARLRDAGLDLPETIQPVEALPYLSFLGLMARARCVLTDSGGIQEETTVLGVPCLTLRWNTERPITVEMGTNRLVGTDPHRILAGLQDLEDGNWPPGRQPLLWDGEAGGRIAEAVLSWVPEANPSMKAEAVTLGF